MVDRGQMKRERGDLLERHTEQFEAYRLNFCPRILKTDAESKLLGMRVYHPPRRITNFTSTEWVLYFLPFCIKTFKCFFSFKKWLF